MIRWNILHRSAIVSITDIAFAVHDTVQRHATQLKKIHFLLVYSRNTTIFIGQPNKGNLFIRPILFECWRYIGADRQNLSTSAGEFFIFIAQARQLRAAIWSHEAAQKCKHNWFAVTKIHKPHKLPVYIFQFKIRRKFARSDQFTHSTILSLSAKYRRTSLLLIYQSMYFAGWGDRNRVTSDQSSVHKSRHEKTSNASPLSPFGRGLGWGNVSISLKFFRMQRAPNIQWLWASRFWVPARDMADNYSTPRDSAYYLAERNVLLT